ncbi:MAG: 2-hydroxychromene-2-carboxylate isomerase [Myxococcota bacterium]
MRFLFDFISPYAYLAWPRTKAIARERDLPLEAIPILFAALLDHHGQLGPAEIPAKRLHTMKHVTRLAADAGLELRMPPAHPFNPLLPLRIATAVEASKRHRVVDALFEATWAKAVPMWEPEAIARFLDGKGLNGRELVANGRSSHAKAELRSATELALDKDVFGVPTVLVEGELFWGYDSLLHVPALLDGADPVTPSLSTDLARMPAQASRRNRR